MKLPDLSYMVKVGQLRYIQSVYETAEHRNPDVLVRDFLPTLQRWACDLRGKWMLPRLRSKPFYYYVIARTRYYDSLFLEAIGDDVNFIVNVGCGSDTRAHRFAHALNPRGITVLECDQPEAIFAKREIAQRRWPGDHVEYLPLDLHGDPWTDFERWLRQRRGANVLVLIEGVSPYVNEDCFGRFLDLLAAELKPGSLVAYDFKLRGIEEEFCVSDQVRKPFRLPGALHEVAAYHEARGFSLERMELSSKLSLRLLPDLSGSAASLFREDCLVRIRAR